MKYGNPTLNRSPGSGRSFETPNAQTIDIAEKPASAGPPGAFFMWEDKRHAQPVHPHRQGCHRARSGQMLLEIKAVHFYSDKPFVFTSGWASPVYIDCRKIISLSAPALDADRFRRHHHRARHRL